MNQSFALGSSSRDKYDNKYVYFLFRFLHVWYSLCHCDFPSFARNHPNPHQPAHTTCCKSHKKVPHLRSMNGRGGPRTGSDTFSFLNFLCLDLHSSQGRVDDDDVFVMLSRTHALYISIRGPFPTGLGVGGR